MSKASIVFLAATAAATFVVLDLLKGHVGAGYAYLIGAIAVAVLVISLIRK